MRNTAMTSEPDRVDYSNISIIKALLYHCWEELVPVETTPTCRMNSTTAGRKKKKKKEESEAPAIRRRRFQESWPLYCIAVSLLA